MIKINVRNKKLEAEAILEQPHDKGSIKELQKTYEKTHH